LKGNLEIVKEVKKKRKCCGDVLNVFFLEGEKNTRR